MIGTALQTCCQRLSIALAVTLLGACATNLALIWAWL
jgi:hypothetical protein